MHMHHGTMHMHARYITINLHTLSRRKLNNGPSSGHVTWHLHKCRFLDIYFVNTKSLARELQDAQGIVRSAPQPFCEYDVSRLPVLSANL